MLRAVPPRSTRERWALLLGRYAERGLGAQLSGRDKRRGAALEFLYGREYGGRGVRGGGGAGSGDGDGERGAGLAPTQLEVPRWLAEVRELFPRETVEVVERHALERYGLSELVTDAEVLAKIEPSLELARAVLSFRHLMKGDVLAEEKPEDFVYTTLFGGRLRAAADRFDVVTMESLLRQLPAYVADIGEDNGVVE